MIPSPQTWSRRQTEYETAKTEADVDALQARWAAEDRALEERQTWQAKALDEALARVAELEKRLAAIERFTGPGGMLRRGISEVIGRLMSEKTKRIVALEQRQSHAMVYKGVFDDQVEYVRGDVVTCAGAAWIALATVKGRPGRAPDWRLMVKSDQKGPGA